MIRRLLVIWLALCGLLFVQQSKAWWQSIQQVAISGGGGNTVTVDQLGTPTGVSAAVVMDINTLTITAGLTNPALVAVCAVSGNASVSAQTAVWDALGTPQSMTLIKDQDAGGGRQVFAFGLRNPTSGNLRFTVLWTTAAQIVCNVISFSHVDPSSDANAFPNPTGSSTGAAPIAFNITTGANNYAIAGYSSAANFTSVTGGGESQLFLSNTGSVWAVGANYKASSGSSVTLTGDPGSATTTSAGMAIAHD